MRPSTPTHKPTPPPHSPHPLRSGGSQGFDVAHVPSRLLAMAKPTYYAVVNYAVDKPAIVFVPSAKQAQLTA
eukprot:4465155-Prymnesium_polylepis.1